MSPPGTPSRAVALATSLAGLALSVVFAVSSDLTLAEFCWSVWLVGLYSAYVSAGRMALRLVRYRDALLRERIPPLSAVSGRALLGVSLVAAALLGAGLLYAFSLAYGFYGVMLSVWVQLSPEDLFGRNGFINSDFWTPVAHLTRLYWPLVAGQLLGEASLLFSAVQQGAGSPERRIVAMHVFVLALPFVALLSYALLGAEYETLGIVILLVIKSLFDVRPPRDAGADLPTSV
jgi:hypothetical protein